MPNIPPTDKNESQKEDPSPFPNEALKENTALTADPGKKDAEEKKSEEEKKAEPEVVLKEPNLPVKKNLD